MTVSGFEAETESIRASGGAAHTAADAVAEEKAGDTATDLVSAMPGSESAEAASSLAEAWSSEFAQWVTSMRTYAGNLHESADTYESNEAAAERALGEVPSSDMGPF